MGEHTGIAWCHHSFNPWWGCIEVSPGCDNCYARFDATRYGHPVWGKDTPRRFFGDRHWSEPVLWNRKAREAGERRRVFCASMADWAEKRADLIPWRQRLWQLIAMCESLDWLMLTKRPHDARRMMPPEIAALPNVWRGVSVENADYLWRLDELAQWHGAGPAWVSYEPALGAVDFLPWLRKPRAIGPAETLLLDALDLDRFTDEELAVKGAAARQAAGIPCQLDWIVVGGESGPNARAFDLAWARQTIAQGRAADTPCFVKQLGAKPRGECSWKHHADSPAKWLDEDGVLPSVSGRPAVDLCHATLDGHGPCALKLRDRKGGDPQEWPEDLRIREFPK